MALHTPEQISAVNWPHWHPGYSHQGILSNLQMCTWKFLHHAAPQYKNYIKYVHHNASVWNWGLVVLSELSIMSIFHSHYLLCLCNKWPNEGVKERKEIVNSCRIVMVSISWNVRVSNFPFRCPYLQVSSPQVWIMLLCTLSHAFDCFIASILMKHSSMESLTGRER